MDSYLAKAFEEQFAEDGLTVLAHGLGLRRLLVKFIQLYCDKKEESSIIPTKVKKLVFIIYSDDTSSRISSEFIRNGLLRNGVMPHDLPKLISGTILVDQRKEILTNGGIFFITSRVLLVDLLNEVINPLDICGLFLPNVHKIDESSTEAFIISLYREKNNIGFIKAFSDDAEYLYGSSSKIQRLLKILHLKRLYLWPRFHVLVSTILNKKQPEVIEISQKMPQSMIDLQKALLVAMKVCVTELKKSTPSLDIELNLENGIYQPIDKIVKKQLEADWYNVKVRVKELISDLSNIRKLLMNLLQHDSLTFYKILNAIRFSSPESFWLQSTEANHLFQKSRNRIYKIFKDNKPNENKVISDIKKLININGHLECTFEPPLKWTVLLNIIEEIKNNKSKGNNKILILVKDRNTALCLNDILRNGIKAYTDSLYRWYVSCQATEYKNKAKIIKNKNNSNKTVLVKETSNNDVYDLGISINDIKLLNNEEKLIILHEYELKQNNTANILNFFNIIDETVQEEETNTNNDLLAESTEEHNKFIKKSKSTNINNDGKPVKAKKQKIDEKTVNEINISDTEIEISLFEPESSIIILTHNNANQQYDFMSDINPEYVILYDPDVALVRSIESYQSTIDTIIKIYFLVYEGSIEEHKYVGLLHKEKKAFENLISTKEHMVVAIPDNPLELKKQIEVDNSIISMDTRTINRGNNKLSDKGLKSIIVDKRDLRSSLPQALHYGGIKIIAETLYIGDYILSSEICIERKGINDLFQSLGSTSGRLFNQIEAMCKHYKYPVLLIEFTENQSFGLVNQNITNPILHKLAVLSFTFPSLLILWSRSPNNTVEIFKAIGKNVIQDPTLKDNAMKLGAPSSDITQSSTDNSKSNNTYYDENSTETAINILKSLPGINNSNYMDIIRNVKDLATLCSMSEADIAVHIGNINAKKLKSFLSNKYVRE